MSPAEAGQAPGPELPDPALRLNLAHAEVWYWPGYLPATGAARLFCALREQLHWKQEFLRIAGRRVPMPRRLAWLAEGQLRYRYSGTDTPPQAIPACLVPLQQQLAHDLKAEFNGVLANRYRNGQDSMGWHADDEAALGLHPTIASISLGATRRFQFKPRRRGDKSATVTLQLEHGSLLVMRGPTQEHWRHQVPKTRRAVGERINLTWRHILSA